MKAAALMKKPPLFFAMSLAGASQACGQTAGAPENAPPLPHDLSPWTMFLSADVLVKAVMISLVFASLATWTIFFAKWFLLAKARRRLATALERVRTARDLSEAAADDGNADILRNLLFAAHEEMTLSSPAARPDDIKERAASRFGEIAKAEISAVREGMSVLATIGSTAPFVGLFGTVWGIMNSFVGITKSQSTNLAVVAPGIAEALLATATGLAAAIPAVMLYNYLARKIRAYSDLVSGAAGAVGRLLSREIERETSSNKIRVAR